MKRLNALLWAGDCPKLTTAELGLLRALISLADWESGAIPYSAERIAVITQTHPSTVSRMRCRLEAVGLLVERWRTSTQVQYGLTPKLRG